MAHRREQFAETVTESSNNTPNPMNRNWILNCNHSVGAATTQNLTGSSESVPRWLAQHHFEQLRQRGEGHLGDSGRAYHNTFQRVTTYAEMDSFMRNLNRGVEPLG